MTTRDPYLWKLAAPRPPAPAEERDRMRDRIATLEARIEDMRLYIEGEQCECDPEVGASPCMRCAILSERAETRKPVIAFIKECRSRLDRR